MALREYTGKVFGRRNVEGERFIELPEAITFIILNTQFMERKNRLATQTIS